MLCMLRVVDARLRHSLKGSEIETCRSFGGDSSCLALDVQAVAAFLVVSGTRV